MPSIDIRHKRALIVDLETNAGWNEYIGAYIKTVLENIGVASDRLLIAQSAERGRQLNELAQRTPALHDTYDFLFTVNRFPSALARITENGRDVDFYSKCQMPILTWYIDNIGHHLPHMIQYPLAAEIPLFVDRCNVAAAQAAGIAAQRNTFLPMWGPARMAPFSDKPDRPLPLVFTGDIPAMPDLSSYPDGLKNASPTAKRLLQDVIEEIKSDKGTVDAFDLCVQKTVAAGETGMTFAMFKLADRWLRVYRRKAVLKRIASLPVVILGDVQDPEILDQSNIEVRGRTVLADAEATLQQAKILIGDFANFVDGIELRPSIAAANGCVLACEENVYARTTFPAGSYLSLLGDPETVDARLTEIADDTDRLIDMDRTFGAFYDTQRSQPLFSTA